MDLSKAFELILHKNIEDNSIIDVCGLISKKGNSTSRSDLKGVLNEHGINSLNKFKAKSLEIVLKYIKLSLSDNILTIEEKNNIRFLKLLFDIEEGEFKSNNILFNEIKNIIKIQLELIYLEDYSIDNTEALHKVDLQEVFGLSYDDFLEISNHFDLLILNSELDKASNPFKDSIDDRFQEGINKMDSFIDQKTLSKAILDAESDNDVTSNDDRSRRISDRVKDRVWNRDGGKCVLCGSNENIEFDHIVPFSKGGSNTYRNIQILCQDCNRRKSDNITINDNYFDDDYDLSV